MEYSSAIDIVFLDRNQAYGAFNLRKVYKDTILKSYAIAALLFLSFVVGPLLAEKLFPRIDVENDGVVDINPTLITPPSIDPKLPPPPTVSKTSPPPPAASTTKFVPPVLANDKDVKEDPPSQTILTNSNPGSVTSKGDPNGNPGGVIDNGPPGTGVDITAPEPSPEEIFLVVEQQPTFPGGDPALIAFVRKNTKYPHGAQKSEVQGTVYIEFIVNPDGHLSDHKILKGQGFGLDEEAMRVVKLFPDWEPGKNNGKAVKVRVSVPIKFRIAN